MSRAYSRDTVIWLLTATIAVGFAFLYLWQPPVSDDVRFPYLYWLHNRSASFSPEALWGVYRETMATDNARLANGLAPLMLVIEPFASLFPWLTAALLLLTARLTAALAGAGRNAASLTLVVLTAMTFLLPWHGGMLLHDYALNYVWGSAIAATLAWLAVKCSRESAPSPGLRTAMLLAAAITGLWHEGIALPMAAALAVGALSTHGRRRSLLWWGTAVIAASAALTMLAPGTLARISGELADNTLTGDRSWRRITNMICPVLAVATFRRSALHSLPYRMFLTSTIVASAIYFVVTSTPRAAYWPQMSGIICLAVRFSDCRLRRRAVIAAGIFTAAFTLWCVRCQWINHLDMKRIEAMGADAPHEATVFADLSLSRLDLMTTLDRLLPPDDIFCIYPEGEDVRVIFRLPEAMADADNSNSLRLGGSAGAYFRDGSLWTGPDRRLIDARPRIRLDYTLRDGRRVTSETGLMYFATRRGDSLIVLTPWSVKPCDIKAVDFVK